MRYLFLIFLSSISFGADSQLTTQLPMDHFAATGQINGRVFHLWDIASARPKNYPKIFQIATEPNLSDFRGHRYNGLILYVKEGALGKAIYTQYTGKNIDLLTGKLYAQALTFQKRFFLQDNKRGESGINFWPIRQVESMPMKIYNANGSMNIDYDVLANNPVTERPLLDEIRQIPGSDLYIGKMYFRITGKKIVFLWFALERAE